MNISHISVSRKNLFDECPQKYKYHYHLKVPIQGTEPFYFIYGKIIHKIAEVFVEEKGKRTIGEVSQDVLRGKIEVEDGVKAPKIPNDYKKRMPEHLRAIQVLTESMGHEGLTEHNFRYDLDPPNNKCVVGFIDRLVIKDGKAIIIDYKTTKKGKWRKNRATVTQDLQLRCYALIVHKEFGIAPEAIKAALCYLEGGEIIGAQFTAQTLENTHKELLDAYNQIQEANPDHVRGKVGYHCDRCDFRQMCPFYKPMVVWDGDMSKLPK